MRRAVIGFIRSLGTTHPNSQVVLNNYIALLLDLGRTENEIKAQLLELVQWLHQNGSS